MSDADIHQLLERGLELHRAGRRAEAEQHYRHALEAAPNHPDALHLFGLVMHQDGRPAEALELIDRASAAEPMRAAYHKHAGLVLLALGRIDASVARLRRAIRLRPEDPESHNHLGTALHELGRPAEAFASYQEALRLAPNYAAAALNLGNVLAEQDRCDEALACYLRARSLEATPQFQNAFAQAFQQARFEEADGIASDPALFELASRALRDPWARPADLSRGCVRLLGTRPSIRDAIARARAAWPHRPPLAELLGDDGIPALAREPLLTALLERAPVADIGLERVLTLVRHALLDDAWSERAAEGRLAQAAEGRANAAADDASIAFRCALARQCFLNGYVFDATEDELARAAELGEAVDQRIRDRIPVAPEWIAAVASYVPLATLGAADRLADIASPGPVAALVRQQVVEPKREAGLRETLPRLTPIDLASAAVRAQYEEHPYPRWTGVARPLFDAGTGARADTGSPNIGSAIATSADSTSAEILVAGCGTGQESTEVALEYPAASVLAVDLSLASLAYATRMANEMQVTNVTHAQADILRLADLGRTFDAIYSVGVLHHLADPAAGLRVLASLLRPDGAMLIGLYSERARKDIVAARAYIAEAGYRPTTADIRRCRQDLMTQDATSAAGSITPGTITRGSVTRLRDFHATNECRDLLFHVEEHRYTLPQVQALLGEAGLHVTAVAAPAAVRRGYVTRFPDDPAMTDLSHWDAFETDHPDIFAGMILLWVARAEQVC